MFRTTRRLVLGGLTRSFGSRRFEYGQNSVIHLTSKNRPLDVKIETLWDDWTEVEVDEHQVLVSDEGQEVFLNASESTDHHSLPVHLKVPEHSGLKISSAGGSIEHINTPTIDGKLKGDFHIKHTGKSATDHIKLRSLQSEDCQISLQNANLIFKSGFQVKQGFLKKTEPGEINYSMLGVAEHYSIDIRNCNLNCKSVYTNPPDAVWGSQSQHPQLSLTLSKSKAHIGVVKGSISAKLSDSSKWEISFEQFDHLSLDMGPGTQCSLYIASMPTRKVHITSSSTSSLSLTCPQSLFDQVQNLFSQSSSLQGKVTISVGENRDNLVGYFVNRGQRSTPKPKA